MSQFLVHYSFFFYITKSSCLISAKFPCCIYLIDSYFFHAMKICTIQGSRKLFFSPLIFFFLASERSFERFFYARIVKMTNSLVEPSPKNSGFLSKLQHQKETSSYTSELIVT
jgi:hypothetical protein